MLKEGYMARIIRAQIPLGVALLTVHASLGLADPASVTYSYDDLGRLRTGEFTGGAANDRKIDYQYDAAGNRTTMTSGLVPTIEIRPASTVSEGAVLAFPVTRRGTSSSNVTVNCVPQNKTAMASNPPQAAPRDDYATTAQTITFLPTDPDPTTKNCLIQTRTDDFYEGTQTLTAVLQNASAGAVIDQGFDQADGSILDAQQPPMFSMNGGSAQEGSAISVLITRTGKSEPSQTVTYATSNGSASTADNDYTAIPSAQFVFANTSLGSLQHQFFITTTHDTKYEHPETIFVPWQVDGVSMGQGTATISNDDPGPRVRINSPARTNEGNPITFTVTNDGNRLTAHSHSITWTLRNGTATAGSDYVNSSGTVSFGNNDAEKLIHVSTIADGVVDGGDETFFVDLSLNAGSNDATIVAGQGTGTGTIADADNPQPSTPGNIRQNPGGNTPIYQILWNASTGAVSYYQLEEMQDNSNVWGIAGTTNAQTLFVQFNKTHSADYSYRVKACSAANVCSSPSAVITRTVCNGMCD
jgi:hypothetical protein